MRLTFLGTGTSHGIPVIGCRCSVCRSENPKNKRTRCGALLETGAEKWLIDTPPEFRLQALREKLDRVDAVLYTHAHADHIFGLDDLRVFTARRPLPVYGSRETLKTLRRTFPYAFTPPKQAGGGFPSLAPHRVRGPFEIGGRQIVPLPVYHGRLRIFGYRIGGLVYITDALRIPAETLKSASGCRVLVLNALRWRPHPTHLSLPQAAEIAGKIGAEKVYFTHICHNLEHEAVSAELPAGTQLAYDGLTVDF